MNGNSKHGPAASSLDLLLTETLRSRKGYRYFASDRNQYKGIYQGMQRKHRLSTTSTTAEDLISRLRIATIDTLTQPTGDVVLVLASVDSETETDAEGRVEANKLQGTGPGVHHGDEDSSLELLNMMPGSYTWGQLEANVEPQVLCCDLAAHLAARGITATSGWCVPQGEHPVGFTGPYLLGFYGEGERKIQVMSKY